MENLYDESDKYQQQKLSFFKVIILARGHWHLPPMACVILKSPGVHASPSPAVLSESVHHLCSGLIQREPNLHGFLCLRREKGNKTCDVLSSSGKVVVSSLWPYLEKNHLSDTRFSSDCPGQCLKFVQKLYERRNRWVTKTGLIPEQLCLYFAFHWRSNSSQFCSLPSAQRADFCGTHQLCPLR